MFPILDTNLWGKPTLWTTICSLVAVWESSSKITWSSSGHSCMGVFISVCFLGLQTPKCMGPGCNAECFCFRVIALKEFQCNSCLPYSREQKHVLLFRKSAKIRNYYTLDKVHLILSKDCKHQNCICFLCRLPNFSWLSLTSGATLTIELRSSDFTIKSGKFYCPSFWTMKFSEINFYADFIQYLPKMK